MRLSPSLHSSLPFTRIENANGGQVTIEIEGHKSKRDFFFSRMQESEEREQLNKVMLGL